MKLITISFAVLSLIPQFNYQPQPVATTTSDSLAIFYNEPVKDEFPDRTKEAEIARQIDIQREQARQAEIERVRAEQQAKAVVVTAQAPKAPTVAQNTPTGSCKDWIIQAGVSDVENAYYLIMKESGCNPNAVNKSSGACGIPQALPCSKLGTSDPVAQIRWMQSYCISRYGSWAGAVAHSKSVGWY